MATATKLQSILSFNQLYWFKKFMDLNTEMRNSTKCKFGKDLYHLMNNVVF